MDDFARAQAAAATLNDAPQQPIPTDTAASEVAESNSVSDTESDLTASTRPSSIYSIPSHYAFSLDTTPGAPPPSEETHGRKVEYIVALVFTFLVYIGFLSNQVIIHGAIQGQIQANVAAMRALEMAFQCSRSAYEPQASSHSPVCEAGKPQGWSRTLGD
ncbi:hypothetical protein FB451DRAFT_1198901 [Mycena latifolia]|nr:hypothetical protein FB451DRAFT_1198901 [Mycena latifolia]